MAVQLFRHQFKAMGGPCELHLWLESKLEFERIVQLLESEVRRLEAKYSRYQPGSLLSAINRGECNSKALDEETVGLLNYVQQCFELSGHVFDPTVGILRQVWQYTEATLPSPDELTPLLENIGWQKLAWNGQTLHLSKGMQLDLGGVVKEFAVDRLVVLLQQEGVIGLVNLAGDIAVSGPPPKQEFWLVAIAHPRQKGAIAEIKLSHGAIASSGDFERYIEVDGKRYCHVLRPDTGYPAQDALASVSVLAPSCLLAGSVTTIAMLKGSGGVQWLKEMELPYLAFNSSLDAFGSIEA